MHSCTFGVPLNSLIDKNHIPQLFIYTSSKSYCILGPKKGGQCFTIVFYNSGHSGPG